jgi:hypothetical protein
MSEYDDEEEIAEESGTNIGVIMRKKTLIF